MPYNAQSKADLKIQRRQAKKTIDKSRDRKRKLKSTEAGFRTPMEEDDARNEADGLDFIIGMEKYEKNVDNRWRELTEAEEARHFERERYDLCLSEQEYNQIIYW